MTTTRAETGIDRFREWAAKAGATVETVADEDAASAAVRRLATGAPRVVATKAGRRFAPDGALVGGSATDVADADLGVSVGLLAVAETGSLLLGSNVVEDRLVAMLTRTHVIVVDGRNLVGSLDAASPILRRLTPPGRNSCAMSGSSPGPVEPPTLSVC